MEFYIKLNKVRGLKWTKVKSSQESSLASVIRI